ncbi:MAG: hypothetical protein R2911_44315 [Caldilineaceae bacterium]
MTALQQNPELQSSRIETKVNGSTRFGFDTAQTAGPTQPPLICARD